MNSKSLISDTIFSQSLKLSKQSSYQSEYDFNIYKDLENRFDGDLKGGIIYNPTNTFAVLKEKDDKKSAVQLFALDTYGRGCTHDCLYDEHRAFLKVHGWWNKPFPMPVDLTNIWKVFYTVFETNSYSPWREMLEKRVPLTIGFASDGFMHMDRKYKITFELLKMLKNYNYPYIIQTQSDLVAHNDYIEVLDKELTQIHIKLASLNDNVLDLLEPGAPSSLRRIKALSKLTSLGFKTQVNIDPLFPIYADGELLSTKKTIPALNIFNMDMISIIAETGCKNISAKFIELNGFSMNEVNKGLGRDLKEYFTSTKFRDFSFSETEQKAYYQMIEKKCNNYNINFTHSKINQKLELLKK